MLLLTRGRSHLETIEELSRFLHETTVNGYRGRLQARGEARALTRLDGVPVPDSPVFAEGIDLDLAEYGFSLLRASLALREQGGDSELWRRGFLQAAGAFEALVQNGSPEDPARGFHRVIGAACYHLASYSALAFSLLAQAHGAQNLAPAEEALRSLILRDLQGMRDRAKHWLGGDAHSDPAVARAVAEGELDTDDAVSIIGTTTLFRALAYFEFALQTGEEGLAEEAKGLLIRATDLAKHANAVPLWWIFRICRNLIEDLWSNSLHRVLPVEGPDGSVRYPDLRRTFIAALYARNVAEIELWPSQTVAARRATDVSDDLVVALPTSAGKTRIAEIAALMALSCGQRVLVVTPLRALSAQMERSFRRTFLPLGFSVSSLYGATGVAGSDEDALRTRSVVIATPEKLDFALRNDPSIINNVGLIVLDEGHLIGPSDREIRYENLVQRLLRRQDHANRRIVCLSAILPEGEQLNDLTAWIRSDADGTPVKSSWRPTRQRFGTLSWLGQSARLGFDLEPDGPYIRHFVTETPAIRPRRRPFPSNNKELTLAGAWKFSEQGKRVLVFCTQRNQVEGFASAVVALHHAGYLPSLLEDDGSIRRAMAVGREWLGAAHPALQCLQLGIAIHHGRLPGPFLRELELLLSAGALRVTIASPTLAQGLNLNAAVMLIPSLYRAGNLITGEEFANVAGRAGRAFVDMEGLVVHVMHDPDNWRRHTWRDLVNSARTRSLLSGIISVVGEVIQRLVPTGVFNRQDAMEYLSNAQEAWFPQDRPEGAERIESLIERLDATVLGLVEALDADSGDLARLLDEALTGSLWSRQIARLGEQHRNWQKWILEARTRLIWNRTTALQRKAQFAMGVGLEAGLAIDAMSADLRVLLDAADAAALAGDVEGLVNAIYEVAQRLLAIRPFVADETLPFNWPVLLRSWLRGDDVAAIGIDNMRVVDEVFVYRLVWAMEAIRMLRRVSGIAAELLEGTASACLEAGLPKHSMAMLVRSGLPSRTAAKIVVEQLDPVIVTRADMILWLGSPQVQALSNNPEWPSPGTHDIWKKFRDDSLAESAESWSAQEWTMNVQGDIAASVVTPSRLEVDAQTGVTSITTPDYRMITGIQQRLVQSPGSLGRVDFSPDRSRASILRNGPGVARWE